MKQDEMHRWAAIGAERRLAELAEETAAIYAAFPHLRNRKQGPARGTVGTMRPDSSSEAPNVPGRRRRRHRLSPEARKRISDAQKARWAKHRRTAAGR
jgi:hypothetical protein